MEIAGLFAGLAALGLWFWVLTVVGFAIVVTVVENEKRLLAFIAIVAYFAVLHLWLGIRPWGYIKENPGWAIGGVLAYFIIGTLYSITKWTAYVKGAIRRYEEVRTKWLREHGVTDSSEVPVQLRREWVDYANSQYNLVTKPPEVSESKERIIGWITYWPFSFVWMVLDDFVYAIGRNIYHFIGRKLQWVADRMFKNVSKDFDVPPSEDGDDVRQRPRSHAGRSYNQFG